MNTEHLPLLLFFEGRIVILITQFKFNGHSTLIFLLFPSLISSTCCCKGQKNPLWNTAKCFIMSCCVALSLTNTFVCVGVMNRRSTVVAARHFSECQHVSFVREPVFANLEKCLGDWGHCTRTACPTCDPPWIQGPSVQSTLVSRQKKGPLQLWQEDPVVRLGAFH